MNQITARDLIAALSALDPDTPITIAHQPTYPMTAEITGVAQEADGTATLLAYGQDGYYYGSGQNDLLDA